MKRSDIKVTHTKGRSARFEVKGPRCNYVAISNVARSNAPEVIRADAVGKVLVHLKNEHGEIVD